MMRQLAACCNVTLADVQEKAARDKRALEAERSSRQHLTGAVLPHKPAVTMAQACHVMFQLQSVLVHRFILGVVMKQLTSFW